MKEVSLRCDDQQTQPVVKVENLFPCYSLFPVGAFRELDSYSFSTSNNSLLTSTMLDFRFSVLPHNFAYRFLLSSHFGVGWNNIKLRLTGMVMHFPWWAYWTEKHYVA